MQLVLLFVITLVSGMLAITGGNGLTLMPSLLMAGFDIKEVLVLIRISAVVFVLFNFVAVVKEKKVPAFRKSDLSITIIACASTILSIMFLAKLDNDHLMLAMAILLIGLVGLVIFKPSGKYINSVMLITLPVFAGVCGGVIGGAGLIISTLYTILGVEPKEALQRRIIPSLVVQLIAFGIFMTEEIHVDSTLLVIVIIGTALAGYFNTKFVMKLSVGKSKALFYASFGFSIINLLKKSVLEIIN